jgi:hypothetical protein
MTPAEFAALSGAIQSLFVASAILCGGLWAIFRFRTLGEAARAQAELARLREALEREPAVRLHADASVFTRIGDVPRSLHVVVRLRNEGKAPDVVDWAASGVFSSRVLGFADATPKFGPWKTTRLVTDLPWKGADIRPGEEAAFSFLVPATECGIYCIEVFIALSRRSVEVSSAAITAAGDHVQEQLEASTVLFVAVPADAATDGH